MRALRILVNWIAILTMPFWGGVVFMYFFYQELFFKKVGDPEVRAWARGDEWFWS